MPLTTDTKLPQYQPAYLLSDNNYDHNGMLYIAPNRVNGGNPLDSPGRDVYFRMGDVNGDSYKNLTASYEDAYLTALAIINICKSRGYVPEGGY